MNEPDSRTPSRGRTNMPISKYCARINQITCRCVILTGAGRAFSGVKCESDAQGNQKDNRRRLSSRLVQEWHQNSNGILQSGSTHDCSGQRRCNAGCDLTCMADIRIASTYARFAETFVKIGISPGDGGAYFLPRVISNSNAAEMVFTGELINADKALEIGLVSKVVEPTDLMKEAKALAERIADNPPHALRLSKKLLRESSNSNMDQLLELRRIQCDAATHEDHRTASTTWSAEFRHVRKQATAGGRRSRLHPAPICQGTTTNAKPCVTLRRAAGRDFERANIRRPSPDRDAATEHDTAVTSMSFHALIHGRIAASLCSEETVPIESRRSTNDVRAGRNLPVIEHGS